ncbi:hypothetical protein ACWV95_07160 [Streptomyces albus]
MSAPTAARAASSTAATPSSREACPSESTASSQGRPCAVTRPTLLITHRPLLVRGSQPFFSSYGVPGSAAAPTPQRWPGTTSAISSRTQARAAGASTPGSGP